MVIYVLIVTCAIAVFMSAAAWPAIRNDVAAESAGERAADDAGTVRAARSPAPESLEGALVTQLAAGAINRRQYLRAMELVAARDAVRHPMSVPSDD